MASLSSSTGGERRGSRERGHKAPLDAQTLWHKQRFLRYKKRGGICWRQRRADDVYGVRWRNVWRTLAEHVKATISRSANVNADLLSRCLRAPSYQRHRHARTVSTIDPPLSSSGFFPLVGCHRNLSIRTISQ